MKRQLSRPLCSLRQGSHVGRSRCMTLRAERITTVSFLTSSPSNRNNSSGHLKRRWNSTSPTQSTPASTTGGDPSLAPLKEEIDISVIAKADIRVATILEAHNVEGADKLVRLVLSVGDIPNPNPNPIVSTTGSSSKRQVFAGIKKAYPPERLVGRQVLFVANLKPRKMRFGISEGMILCASDPQGEKIILTALDAEGGAQDGMCIS